jgi:phage recombination protein Bet
MATTELEKKVDPKQQALIDTVRKTVFPDGTDAELALFFHKCNVIGVNPLDQLIHPTKFRQPDGTSKVTFITSINLLRSKSNEGGLYDGMDEPEYGDEIEHTHTDDNGTNTIQVPEWALVRIYRKDIGRPFIGKARWKEYYPGAKKGHQWRQRPYHMLAKCAEALARRLAFPDKLNQLYSEEEMMSATEQLAGIEAPKSTKPAVSPDQVRPRSSAPEGNKNTGTVERVEVINGVNKTTKKPWTKYGVVIGKVTYGTFDADLGKLSEELKGCLVDFTFTDDGKYKTITGISLASPKEPENKVEDNESFATTLTLLASDKGISGDAAINAILEPEFGCTIDTIPADIQKSVLEYFEAL